MMSSKFFIVSIIIFGLLCLGFSYIINASDTGALSPSATGSYKNEWTNPTYAYSENDVYATGTTSTADEQDYYNFGFSFGSGTVTSIDGIKVESNAYGSSTNFYLYCKLSYDGGSSWTSEKNVLLPTSDSDTYVTLGGSTDTWGRTWTSTEFSNSNFRACFRVYHLLASRTGYIDHIRITVYYTSCDTPLAPTNLDNILNTVTYCNNFNLTWTKGTYTEYTHIQFDYDTYPTTISDGFDLCNTTNNYYNYAFDYNKDVYISAWGFDTNCNLWSSSYATDKLKTPCNPSIYLYDENFINCTYTNGIDNELTYDKSNGWYIWVNMTGNTTPLTHYENIVNATGTHEHSLTSTGYKIWANYTGNPSICPPCNSTNLTVYNNTVNVTGNYETSYYNLTGWYIWLNYTGKTSTGVGCGIFYLNYSDNNITVNLTVNCSSGVNTSNYTINEDNWLNIMDFMFEEGNLGIFIVLIIFSIAFYVDKDENKVIWKPILFFLDVPIALATGIFYIGNNINTVNFWIGIFMFMFSIVLSFAGIYYSLGYGRKYRGGK